MWLSAKYKLYILCICIGIIGAGIFVPISDGKSIFEYARMTKRATDAYLLDQIVHKTTAKSVVVYDISRQRVVSEKNKDYVMSLASITKVFTSVVLYEKLLQSNAKNSPTVVSFLREIQRMMMTSSNEEAEYLSSYFGEDDSARLSRMNAYIHPYQIHFRNVTGLDIPGVGVGAYGKSMDVALAVVDVYKKYPEIFDKTILPVSGNTNHVADKLNFFVAGKTGFTNLSGGNLVVILQKGITHKYLILVLGSTENGRFVDVENIAQALLQLDV